MRTNRIPIHTHAAKVLVFAALIWSGFTVLGPVNLLHAAPKAELLQAEQTHLVNVNSATEEELQTIRGIGPALAARVVAYRSENGAFETAEDLANVRGIGGAKLQQIKSQVTV